MGTMETVATTYTMSLSDGEPRIRCQLVVIEGPDTGRACPLGKDPVVVGTKESCDLIMTDDRISSRHLQVQAQSGRFLVRDLGSKNGTQFEGALVSETLVAPGATFRLGHSFVRIQPQPVALLIAPSQSRRFGELVGESLVMREVFAVLELAAASDATILLEGETGTGKELAARAIHAASNRRSGPFVALDCGTLPVGLLESELFGHAKGAFTGALNSRDGAFVRAHQGTLFLDELDSISSTVQSALLRVLEERRVRPVGADQEREVDVRIVAASQKDLATLVAQGAYRADLYYRLSVVRIRLPALRQRREDIVPLVREMLSLRGIIADNISGSALDRLMAHNWPGNARELRNVIDRALALTPRARCFADLRISIEPQENLPVLPIRTELPFGEAKQLTIEAFEKGYLQDLLERCNGNISAVAREAKLDRKHVRKLVKRHNLLKDRG
jgi:DNA-binding NtrC family response regulator